MLRNFLFGEYLVNLGSMYPNVKDNPKVYASAVYTLFAIMIKRRDFSCEAENRLVILKKELDEVEYQPFGMPNELNPVIENWASVKGNCIRG